MADDIKVEVKGLAELEKRLEAMGQEMAAKSIMSAAYSSNKILLDAAKSTLESDGSVDTGLLRDSLTRKKVIYANDGKAVIITGVNKAKKGVDSKGKRRVPWRYAHLVESKTHFMKRAYESVREEVVSKFVAVLTRKIKKFEKGNKS